MRLESAMIIPMEVTSVLRAFSILCLLQLRVALSENICSLQSSVTVCKHECDKNVTAVCTKRFIQGLLDSEIGMQLQISTDSSSTHLLKSMKSPSIKLIRDIQVRYPRMKTAREKGLSV